MRTLYAICVADVNDAITALDNAGNAVLRISTGAPPAETTDADTGTLLIQFTMPRPSFGAANVFGVSAANAINPATVTGAGTNVAGYWRLKTAAGTVIFQGIVGVTGSGASLTFDNTTWTLGDVITITSMSLYQPPDSCGAAS